jgi:putative NIF3 family GTP cyclohydrolase 1 type 2
VVAVLGLTDVRPLTTELRDGERAKLVTFVPPEALDAVLDAVSAAGAGRIGDYERCSFRVRGTGTFRPLPGTDPYSGRGVGQDAEEEELRLEVELPTRAAGRWSPRCSTPTPTTRWPTTCSRCWTARRSGSAGSAGSGPPVRSATVAAAIRDQLPAPHLRFAGDPSRSITTVAVVGGAGDSLIGAALGAGVDVYVTGDLRHHVTLDALEQGLALIDAGHHATEVAAMPPGSSG